MLLLNEHSRHRRPLAAADVALLGRLAARGPACRRMTSGAGHDAQTIARIAPSATIFVPSVAGVSHNPREYTADADLVAGAQALLDVVGSLASERQP